jgi:hypothetical protein
MKTLPSGSAEEGTMFASGCSAITGDGAAARIETGLTLCECPAVDGNKASTKSVPVAAAASSASADEMDFFSMTVTFFVPAELGRLCIYRVREESNKPLQTLGGLSGPRGSWRSAHQTV